MRLAFLLVAMILSGCASIAHHEDRPVNVAGGIQPPQPGGVSAVRVFVADFQRALAFYTGPLRLRVAGTDESTWALFRLSNAGLLIEAVGAENTEDEELVGRFTGVSFDTENVQGAFDELSALGVRFEGPPEKQLWGGTLAHFYDPDGNALTLVEAAKSQSGSDVGAA